jgi:hypothetical protein
MGRIAHGRKDALDGRRRPHSMVHMLETFINQSSNL